MSFSLPLNLLDRDWKNYIKKECNITSKNQYMAESETITIFKVVDKTVHLPLAIWYEICDEFPNFDKKSIISADFTGELLEEPQRDQKTAMREALELLKERHCALLALRTGFGKTFCSLYLICKLAVKTVVLCHATTLHKQWCEEAKKYCPDLKIQIVKGKTLDPDADVYMMGVIKASHFEDDVFSKIGLVVVDECHLTLTTTFTNSLLKFKPKYLIGLSATPDRRDGMHNLLYPFFGVKSTFIVRHEVKNFEVIKYETYFKPDVRYNFNGTLDWTGVTKSMACNEIRQRFIATLTREYKNRSILILTDYVCEVVGCENYPKCTCINGSPGLYPLLKDDESVDYRAYDRAKHDETKRIIIGTFGKLGVGYDSKRDMLILSTDKTDIRQYEGRLRGSDCLVIDIVDNFKTFQNHWKNREKWYKQRGATVIVKQLKQPERKRFL